MLNIVILIGRLVKDCECKKTTQGTSVCNFGIAITENPKADNTEFIDCTAWRQNADFLGAYGKKGMLMLVVGKVHKNVRTDKDGNKKYEEIIECKTVRSLERKNVYEQVATEMACELMDADLSDAYEELPY